MNKEDGSNPQSLKVLKLRRTLPRFDSNFRHSILKLDLPNRGCRRGGFGFETDSGVTSPSARCLNTIFKQAKNLKSVTLQPDCEVSNFKGLRKARGLENLSLNICGRHIKAYPQLFKGLICLRKVTLNIKSLGSEETEKFFKFFDYLLCLPRLEHVTIWLEDNFGHYKRLLRMIHEKKLPSFHIRDYLRHSDCEKSLPQCCGNYIDTLYLGPIEPNQPLYQFSSSKNKPKKKLSLRSPVCFQCDLHDLFEGSSTIRNLYIEDLFASQANPTVDMAKHLLEFFSKTKSLENIALIFGPSSLKYSEIVSEFIEKFSQIESFESLETLTFSLEKKEAFPKLLPPYSSRMRNLTTLDIKLRCIDLELFYFLEPLKYLESLEEFKMGYSEENIQKKEIECDIPLECLRNLKKMSLTFNVRFSEASAKNFIEGIHRLGNLRVLFVSPMVLSEIGSENASRLIEDFRGMKSLESASFAWKKEESEKLVYIDIRNEDGEIKIVGKC